MKRPLSQLVYARVRDEDASPHIITLHDRGLFGPSAAEFGLAASATGRVLALESYKGVYVGRSVVGYTWFVGPDDQPSPIFFGDALAEIERFLWDEVDRQASAPAELPFLVGIGQGGIMALAAAAAVPDLLSGVIAIDAFLPTVPGWSPPLVPLAGLPLLLVERAGFISPGDRVHHGAGLVHMLEEWDAVVTYQANVEERLLALILRDWTTAQPVRQRRPGEPA
jgi:pimeloyl-ACP methyl ester carboxylesterase